MRMCIEGFESKDHHISRASLVAIDAFIAMFQSLVWSLCFIVFLFLFLSLYLSSNPI